MDLTNYRGILAGLSDEQRKAVGEIIELAWIQGNENARRIVYSSSYKEFGIELQGGKP